MTQILRENQTVLNIIGKPKETDGKYRFCHYTVAEPVDAGMLLFNTLTREMILLTQEEYDNALENPYLREKWFVVPEDTCEKQKTQMVRWVQKVKKKKKDRINFYTIYTTTDCNARCFYCFELGRKRTPMSDEVAYKTAEFIKANCDGRPVGLRWFGGEPLYNSRAMDIICTSLREAGIEYASDTTSNGYLFNEENVEKCVNLWNMKRVQVSMDGTEEVYNKSKRYIYKEGNPYQIVMGNIKNLLDHGITTVVRLNMDMYNLKDLYVFAEELARRFGSYKKFYVYSHLIIDEKKQWNEYRTEEEWNELYIAKEKFEEHLRNLNIHSWKALRLHRTAPQSSCMVDDPSSIVITPDGSLGVCEHFSETHLIGHMDSPERDQSVIEAFRERGDEVPECDTCFHYPQCVRRVKMCPYYIPCIGPERVQMRKRIGQAMIAKYNGWLNNEDDDHVADNRMMSVF